MQLALPSPMPDASSPVFAVNGGKPHQGVTGKNPGPHQGLAACNSTTALGVSWRQWSGTAPGARVTYEYDAFGNLLNPTSNGTPNNYLYRGEQYDPDLGLYYLRARYYNPISGRFMSRDPDDPKLRVPNGTPIDPKSLHKYLYAGGDPVNSIDPSGRDSIVEFALQEGDDEASISALHLTARQVQFDLCEEELIFGFADMPLGWAQILEYCGGVL